MTDHACLQFLDSVKDNGGKRTRWTLLLQEYDFEVIHRPGKENGNADGLSRQAWEETIHNPEEGVGGSVVGQETTPLAPNNNLPTEKIKGQGTVNEEEGVKERRMIINRKPCCRADEL